MQTIPAPMSEAVARAAVVQLPTRFGAFVGYGYRDQDAAREHIALVHGDVTTGGAPLVRVHSACLTGDIFGSLRCDCGPQLEAAMAQIVAHGRGILVYLDQEGRGIGLLNKLKAYELQEQGLDTIEANLALGLPADSRDFRLAAAILRDLGVGSIRLLTNNPDKIDQLARAGIQVEARVPVQVPANVHNVRYLETKRVKTGHMLRAVPGLAHPRPASRTAPHWEPACSQPDGVTALARALGAAAVSR
jgi:3,4-dihydroxy 2-butanone 4-phosphate synthase / GTP cyclohydrolase II